MKVLYFFASILRGHIYLSKITLTSMQNRYFALLAACATIIRMYFYILDL